MCDIFFCGQVSVKYKQIMSLNSLTQQLDKNTKNPGIALVASHGRNWRGWGVPVGDGALNHRRINKDAE